MKRRHISRRTNALTHRERELILSGADIDILNWNLQSRAGSKFEDNSKECGCGGTDGGTRGKRRACFFLILTSAREAPLAS